MLLRFFTQSHWDFASIGRYERNDQYHDKRTGKTRLQSAWERVGPECDAYVQAVCVRAPSPMGIACHEQFSMIPQSKEEDRRTRGGRIGN